MLIKLLISLASDRGDTNSGSVHDWPDEDAARLIKAGYAEDVTPPAPKPKTPPETAVLPVAPETATVAAAPETAVAPPAPETAAAATTDATKATKKK